MAPQNLSATADRNRLTTNQYHWRRHWDSCRDHSLAHGYQTGSETSCMSNSTEQWKVVPRPRRTLWWWWCTTGIELSTKEFVRVVFSHCTKTFNQPRRPQHPGCQAGGVLEFGLAGRHPPVMCSFIASYGVSVLKLKFHWDQFPVTSSRTCWRRRQLSRNKLATSYEEVGDIARPSGHVEMVWKSPASS